MHPLASCVFLLLCVVSAGACADGAFRVTSADLRDRQPLHAAQVLKGFGCDGGNRLPALAWSGAPAGTQGFAVTIYDPDAPTGSGWWHWVVVDLPASVHALPAGAGSAPQVGRPGGLPDGLPSPARQGRNDFGGHDFGGACPPEGDAPHRYVVTVHALKTAHLDVPDDASPALIGFMLHANRLASATLTATYARPRAR